MKCVLRRRLPAVCVTLLACAGCGSDSGSGSASSPAPSSTVEVPSNVVPGTEASGSPTAGDPPSGGAGGNGNEPGGEPVLNASGTPLAPQEPQGAGATGGGGNGTMSGAQGGGTGEPSGAGGSSEPEGDPEPAQPPGPFTLFIAGDSTVQTYVNTASTRDQAGWGQMLGAFLSQRITVDNRSIGGRTARRFIDEGRLDDIDGDITAGDYLLVQWGTNDSNGSPAASYTIGNQTIPYFLDPATDFKTYLQRYLSVARAHGATPVFVTPPPRNSAYCTGGNGTAGHAAAMRELGQAENVPVLDLNAKSVAYLRAICPAPVPEDFFLLRADGTVDGTHFQENGARILARLIADGAREAALPFFDPAD